LRKQTYKRENTRGETYVYVRKGIYERWINDTSMMQLRQQRRIYIWRETHVFTCKENNEYMWKKTYVYVYVKRPMYICTSSHLYIHKEFTLFFLFFLIYFLCYSLCVYAREEVQMYIGLFTHMCVYTQYTHVCIYTKNKLCILQRVNLCT